jgi:dihydrofolate reductase
MFDIVVAFNHTGGIGYKGSIPWKCSEDLKYFKRLTTETKDPAKRNVVIMGRRTWDSLPTKPLPGRHNIVISSTLEILPPSVYFACTLEGALYLTQYMENVENVFVIGGSQLYQEALHHPECNKVYATLIHDTSECDAFFPVQDLAFFQKTRISTTESDKVEFYVYEKIDDKTQVQP